MTPVDYALLIIAILGVVDAELDRRTGRGFIARVEDWCKRG